MHMVALHPTLRLTKMTLDVLCMRTNVPQTVSFSMLCMHNIEKQLMKGMDNITVSFACMSFKYMLSFRKMVCRDFEEYSHNKNFLFTSLSFPFRLDGMTAMYPTFHSQFSIWQK